MSVEKATPQPPRDLYTAAPTLPRGSAAVPGLCSFTSDLALPWRAPRPHSFWFWLCRFLLEDVPAFAREL